MVVDHPHRNIRFVSTEDGVDIAFWEIGQGKPIIVIQSLALSHAELEWEVPSVASFYTDMAERYRVIRFDPRGIGISGEPPGGWGAVTSSGAQQGMSMTEMGLDISAVATALGLDSFALMGVTIQGPVAIAYAATHPEVSELILFDTTSRISTSPYGAVLRSQIGLALVEEEAGGPVFNLWERVGPTEEVGQLLKLVRASEERSQVVLAPAQLEWDAESLMADVVVPTLILTMRNTTIVDSLPDARNLAAGIEGSQLVGLEADDRGWAPHWTKRTATLKAIDDFLQPDTRSDQPLPSGFRTVVFTDMVGSTDYVRRVGDEAGRTALREVEGRVASLAAEHGGRVVKNLGDGSLVSFGSNTSDISFAIDLQEVSRSGPLQIRVGMAAGEPIQEDGDIHGTVVAHASRIADLGSAGEVMVSDSVRQLAAGKGFVFVPAGEVLLKGFDEPEKVWNTTRP